MGKKNSGENGEAAATQDKPKRSVRRRPMWVMIPSDFKTVLDATDEPTQVVDKYRVYKCDSVDAVRDVLSKNTVDPTNIDQVIMFRADPLKFQISSQIKIKF